LCPCRHVTARGNEEKMKPYWSQVTGNCSWQKLVIVLVLVLVRRPRRQRRMRIEDEGRGRGRGRGTVHGVTSGTDPGPAFVTKAACQAVFPVGFPSGSIG